MPVIQVVKPNSKTGIHIVKQNAVKTLWARRFADACISEHKLVISSIPPEVHFVTTRHSEDNSTG